MKRIPLFIISALAITVLMSASGNNHFLLAENFFLHKGDKLSVKLFTGIQGGGNSYYQSPVIKSGEFALYEGSKKIELKASISDTAVAVYNYAVLNQGIALLELTQTATQESDTEDLAQYLEEENLKTVAEKVKTFTGFNVKETYHRYLKTLVKVDKHSGDAYEKLVGDEYEIILKNNPYKMNYGDDVIAAIYHKGKLLEGAPVVIYIKSPQGTVYPEKVVTDAKGQVYFKLNREGIYMIRSLYAVPGKNDDLETWWASYSFAFSSANELPNTYKEFGFGDFH